MATVTTPTAVRGLLVHDPRLTADDIVASDSAGPRPSLTRPTSATVTRSVLEASGEADGTSRTIHVTRGGGGIPGTAARWGWSTDGTSATQRGAWNRRIFSGYEPVVLTTGSYQAPLAVTTSSGRMVIIYYNGTKIVSLFRDVDDESVSTYGLRAWGTGGDVGTAGAGIPAALIRLPDSGRLLCLVVTSATYGVTTYTTFDLYYSDSDGTTWTLGQTDVGARFTGATYGAAHLVYHQGYLTLVVVGSGGSVGSWVSYDLGASFVELEAIGSWIMYASAGMVACDDGSVLLFYVDTTGNLCITRKRTPTAKFEDDASFGTQIAGAVWKSANTASLSACIDDDGLVVVVGRAVGDRNLLMLRCRQDVASTADVLTDYAPGDATVLEPAYFGSGASGYLRCYSLLPWRDCLYLLTLDDSGSPTLALARFGGWSSVDWDGWPSFGAIYGSATVYGWVWAGSLDPVGCGWTATGAGTGAVSNLGGWAVTTTANRKQYARTGGSGKPVVAWARVRVGAGGSLTADDIAMRLVYDTGAGSNRYDISIRFSGTGIRMYDNTAAGTVGTDVSGLTSGNYVDVLVSLGGNGSRAVVYYKTPAATLWTLGPNGTATAAATASANTATWGNLSVAGTATSHWAWVLTSMDSRVQSASMAEPVGFIPVNGREMSSRPLWVQSGIYVRAMSTPFYAGETFALGTRYDHGALDPVTAVAPGQDWRATDDGAEVTITWTPEVTTAANSYVGSTSLGTCLRAPNFRTAYLEGYDGSSWTTLVSVDTATGMASLEFSRSGYVLAPTGSPTGGRYAQQDEYAEGYALLVNGGTTYPVKIEGNQAGAWRGAGGGPKLLLHIDRTANLTGLPTSGTIHLIPPLYVALAHGIATAYRAFRLRIPAQDTAEGYFRLARPPIFGPFLAFGRQYEQGRLIGPILAQEESTLRSGARRVRQIRRPRRYAELAWTSAIVGGGTGGAWGGDPSAVAVYNSVPVALARDPAMLEGVLQVTRGARQPVVYLPRVATGSSTSQISARELVMPARVTGEGGARTAVMGRQEYDDEASTLGVLRLEELA